MRHSRIIVLNLTSNLFVALACTTSTVDLVTHYYLRAPTRYTVLPQNSSPLCLKPQGIPSLRVICSRHWVRFPEADAERSEGLEFKRQLIDHFRVCPRSRLSQTCGGLFVTRVSGCSVCLRRRLDPKPSKLRGNFLQRRPTLFGVGSHP